MHEPDEGLRDQLKAMMPADVSAIIAKAYRRE